MFRTKAAGAARERKDRITWRSHEVTRIEAFSDAVFAFAITLLIVSLEVPKSFDEMLEGMRSFLPFAVCFALLFQIWMTQNVFFRRFGLSDDLTLMLNAALLFVVLFFVYPLKFLFSASMLHGYAFEGPEQVQQLFYIYSGGFAGIYLLFALLYWNALKRRGRLALTESEVFEAKTTLYRHLVMTAIGLLSVIIASFGSKATIFAGLVYVLIGPALGFTHGHRGRRYRARFGQVPAAADERETAA